MDRMTWVDVAEAMLEGAAMLPECSGVRWEDADGEETRDREMVAAACALGAAEFIALGRLGYWDAAVDLRRRYGIRYGAYIAIDNDHQGRDYVLANVKELLNEASS